MEIPFRKKITTEEETISVAKEFSSILNEGEVVVLNGNLGAGKTFFIKKVLETFNVTNVNSPTFSIVNEYNGSKKFYHFDFYRIDRERELYDIGFDEYMLDPEAIKFIEWGELFNEVLPSRRKEITIDLHPDSTRDLNILQHE